MTRPKIISLVNNKGGVGKTTTAINLAYSLTLDIFGNNNVLLIDADAQHNASIGLNFPRKKITEMDNNNDGFYKILMDKLPIATGIFGTDFKGLDIVPGSKSLKNISQRIAGEFDQNFRLKKVIEKSKEKGHLDKYNYIIIDCSPALSVLEYNALMVSDYVIVPIKTAEYAYDGIEIVIDAINEVKEQNKNLEFLGIVFTQVVLIQNLLEEYKKDYIEVGAEDMLFDTFINSAKDAEMAVKNRKPIYEYKKNSKVAQKYLDFTEEMLTKINKREGRE
jgi:chromosome partitioning protein